MRFYGMNICPDCVAAIAAFEAAGLPYEMIEITETTANMKEFLAVRDSSAVFDSVRENKGIGIPCFILGEGLYTLSLEEAVAKAESL